MASREVFLKETAFEILKGLEEDKVAAWGMMSAQHMIEHLSGLFLFTIEKVKRAPFYTEEKLQRNYKNLITEDKPFARNIRIKGLEKPLPLRFNSLEEAINQLEKGVKRFYTYFENKPQDYKTIHPSLGGLNFEEWELFHSKHFKYHFSQFELLVLDESTEA